MSPWVSVLGVDPGLKGCGWAVALQEDGSPLRVVRLGVVRRVVERQELGDLCRYIATSIEEATHLLWPFACAAAELPQAYSQAKTPGDPNDNIDLAAVAGAVVCFAGAEARRLVRPAVWQRATGAASDKAVRHKRLLRSGVILPEALARLEASTITSLRHNALDAAGVAIWAVTSLGLTKTANHMTT